MNKITHLIIGQMCWGSGTSFEEAKANFKKSGGNLRKPHGLYTFGPSSTCVGVDGIGNICYSGEAPVHSQLR